MGVPSCRRPILTLTPHIHVPHTALIRIPHPCPSRSRPVRRVCRLPYNDGVNISDETLTFIRQYRTENVRDLALRAKRDDRLDLPFALDQIAGWQTARAKLPAWAACDGVLYPPHLSMEQCSSQATAEYKRRVARRLVAVDGSHRTSMVDLTGGFGVDGSYLAREFDDAVYVERQANLCALAEHNMAALGLDHVRVVNADAEDFLREMPQVDFIFLDPARRDAHGARTYAIQDCTPDVLGLCDALLGKAPHVMVKLSPMLDWHKTVEDFEGLVAETHIVSTANECKELLLVLSRERHATPRMVCVNDDEVFEPLPPISDLPSVEDAGARQRFASHERELPDLTDPASWRYLYEPNASIMKAGCFAQLSMRFDVCQIAPNSHLFVAAEPQTGFPGRAFAIDSVCTMNKRELKQALGGLTHANIAVRNFPLSAPQLRAKLKLKDGGDTYLFATTDSAGVHRVIRTGKLG